MNDSGRKRWMRIQVCVAALLMSLLVVAAEDPKNHDFDVVRNEAAVPPYQLPPILVASEGKPVTTPQEWFQTRRPQIMSLFANLIYGVVPQPEFPVRTTFEVVKKDDQYMEGIATRKEVRIRFQNEKGSAELQILVFSPNGSKTPAPAILLHSFAGTRDAGHDAHPEKPGYTRNGLPLGEIFKRGFGFVVVPQDELVRHNEVEFQRGVHPLFYRAGQSFPKANEWGVIATVSWSASRAMDYLETDPDIDAHRIAAMGHSKMGKAALWTCAQDQRFAMAILAQSGCAGAALWKRNFGENMEKMVTRFPYWLCRNAWKFMRNEEDLPVDQHMLLACIAPRPLYVASGEEDLWADPRGEYLSAYHASEVYRLLQKKGLESESSPPVGSVLMDGLIGYHNRPGGHSVEKTDWDNFLKFAALHLQRQ